MSNFCPCQKLESIIKKEGKMFFEKCTVEKLVSPIYAYGKLNITPEVRTYCKYWNGNECGLDGELRPKLKNDKRAIHLNSYRNVSENRDNYY